MRAFNLVRRIGLVLIIACLVVVVAVPAARPDPDLEVLTVVALVAIAGGIVTGIFVRNRVTLDRRLRVMSDLNPCVGRWLLKRKSGIHNAKPEDDNRS